MRIGQEQSTPPPFENAAFDLIVIASSAGGIHALSIVLSALPPDFPAGVVVVQHLDPRHRSLIAEILAKQTQLEVRQAREGDRVTPGVVYIAPPDRHLLINPDGTITLTRTELIHFVRPSADLLFESAAAAYKSRIIAVVLTGAGSDGAMGVEAVKKVGGTTISQDEKTSEYFGMPGAAISTNCVDFILPLEDVAPALVTLVMGGDQ